LHELREGAAVIRDRAHPAFPTRTVRLSGTAERSVNSDARLFQRYSTPVKSTVLMTTVLMTRCVRFSLAGSLLLLLVLSAGGVQAQEWGAPIQVVTPVKHGGPIHTFLDSLSAALEKNPELQVRRTLDDVQSVPFHELERTLLEEGLEITSASHVFVWYRFALDGSRIVESIDEMQFIYHENASNTDRPLLHVSTWEPAFSDVLVGSGFSKSTNIELSTSFRALMAFPILGEQQETYVVESSRRPPYYNFGRRRVDELMRYLDTFIYGTTDSYGLTTGYQRIHEGAVPTPFIMPTVEEPAEETEVADRD
jgi:hypothetical protein